jgi:hypothetical protein
LKRFDSGCSPEHGAPTPLGWVQIPTFLKPGVYFIDQSWLFFVRGVVSQSEVAIILPMSTMHCFNEAFGGSMYTQNFRVRRCSMNRPLHRRTLSDVRIFELMLVWFSSKLEINDIAYVPEYETPQLVAAPKLKLVVIPGRSEDWTNESRRAVKALIDSGVNVMCMSGETMYSDITIDIDAGFVQRYSFRSRWVEKDGVNPLTNIIGCNPYHGGLCPGMWRKIASGNDPGFGRFTVVAPEDELFQGTGVAVGSRIDLPSMAYDGLPVLEYDENGFPVLDLSDFGGWTDIRLLAFCCGETSPEGKIGAFARFDAGPGKGKLIHMGSMAWSTRQAFDGTSKLTVSILDNVIDELLTGVERCDDLRQPEAKP